MLRPVPAFSTPSDSLTAWFVQFTAKSLQRQAREATKEEGCEKGKLKKVGQGC